MHATLVHFHVKSQHVDDLIRATGTHHRASSKQPGNLRFDVLQLDSDPSRFVLYEAYVSAADTYKQSPHYLAWRHVATPLDDRTPPGGSISGDVSRGA